ncbi:hypothetical protein SLS60_010759 [Paraconiothyrium brasiliense]|uniref:Uncharacterized protein n=1 Tax=Paraconiothyrium brasiliense TaxID=300254 RepID=A0ABR3QLX9_9PLEO
MAPYNPQHGFPNPFPRRAEAAPYAGATGLPPNSNFDTQGVSTAYTSHTPYPHQPLVPPRRAPSGRLANRYNGITMHQDASKQAPVQTAPGTIPGGTTPFPFPPGAQNMHPQANTCSQYPEPHIPPGQNFAHAPPSMTNCNPHMGGEPQGTNGSASQFPSMSSLQHALPQHTPLPSIETGTPPPRPEYLIIGLFALRITRRLILYLDPYQGSDFDIRWLDSFLQPYPPSYALAKLTDPRTIEEYVQKYPSIVRTMIKQPRYRRVFMDMNPERKETQRELSDEELSAIIDFVDAAGEWGSVVPVPGKYAQRMEELAKGRRMFE